MAEKDIRLPTLKLLEVEIDVKGTSSLIQHRWSEKAKEQMLAKQTGAAKLKKEAKDPQQQFEDSMYTLPDGTYGFPAVAFKAAAVRAGTYADEKMTFLRGAFHVRGELVPITGTPEMREDMVRLQGRTADIRYRGEFLDWSATIPVTLNETALSVDQLINLFRIAGFAVGVGEWRPEKNGQHGRFEIVDVTIR